MVKMNLTNNQTAFEYALYEIADSYFENTECVSSYQESKLRVQFMEQKVNNQLVMEENCIKYMNDLMKKIPKKVLKEKMEVHLVGRNKGESTDIIFKSERYMLIMRCQYAGKNSKIKSILLERKKELSEQPTKREPQKRKFAKKAA